MGEVVQLSSYDESARDPVEPNWGDEHARLIGMFEEAEDASRDNCQRAERDVDYYDGKQWTEKEVAKLRKRGQAALMDNHVKPKIRYLQGLEQSRRTDPKASPRTPQHEQDANSCTDALRFVCDQNKFNKIRSKAFKDVLSAGWGGYEVTVEQKPGPQEPGYHRSALRRGIAWAGTRIPPTICTTMRTIAFLVLLDGPGRGDLTLWRRRWARSLMKLCHLAGPA
jgi:hypothetical protein